MAPGTGRILLVSLLVAAICWLLARTPWLEQAERETLDVRFRLGSQGALVDPRIVIVEINDDTFDRLINPESDNRFDRADVYWIRHYGRATRRILEAGAAVVGLDVLLTYREDELWRDLGEAAVAWPDRVVLAGYLFRSDKGQELLVPFVDLQAAVGAHNIGLVNLTTDSDGVLRAQSILPVPHTAEGRTEWPFFAAWVASRVKPQDKVVPTTGDNRMLINWSREGSFPRVALHDVLDMPSDELRRHFNGKVVLLGTTAARDQDLVQTPISVRDPMAGVEVHANIVNTLLTGQYIIRPHTVWVAAWTALLSMGIGLAAWSRPAPQAAILAAAVIALHGGAVQALFVWGQVWMDVLAVLMSVPCTLLVHLVWRSRIESSDRQRLMGVFGRCVSPEVMQELLDDPSLLQGHLVQRHVAVLFSDINGFSTISETRPPADVLHMLNEYFQEMTAIIFRHHGMVKQFVGDEIMAIYGAPRPHDTPEKAAVYTALEMIDRLQQLAAQDPSGNGFYSTKIGIHCGDVTLGLVGSVQRSEYAAVGDDVNLGSRIMVMTKDLGAAILISDAVYEKVKDMPDATFIHRGTRDVKGRQGQVDIYEVRRA